MVQFYCSRLCMWNGPQTSLVEMASNPAVCRSRLYIWHRAEKGKYLQHSFTQFCPCKGKAQWFWHSSFVKCCCFYTLKLQICKKNLSKSLNHKGQHGAHHWPLRSVWIYFLLHTYSKPTCLALGSPKINFLFTPNLVFHIFSDFFDHPHQPSHV